MPGEDGAAGGMREFLEGGAVRRTSVLRRGVLTREVGD